MTWRAGMSSAQMAGAFDAGHPGQVDVHQDHLRLPRRKLDQRFLAGADGTDALESGTEFKDAPQAFPDAAVVLDDSDFDHGLVFHARHSLHGVEA